MEKENNNRVTNSVQGFQRGDRVLTTNEVLVEHRGSRGVVVDVRWPDVLVAFDTSGPHAEAERYWYAPKFLVKEPVTALATTSATARRCRACIVAWPSGTKCADHQDPDARSTTSATDACEACNGHGVTMPSQQDPLGDSCPECSGTGGRVTSDATDSPIVHATHAKQKMADRIAEDVAKYAAQGASKESLKPRIQRLFHDAIVEAHMAGREYERARCPDYAPEPARDAQDIIRIRAVLEDVARGRRGRTPALVTIANIVKRGDESTQKRGDGT